MKNYRSEHNRQLKNGEDVEGGWCEREFQEESDEGPVKVWCWTQVAHRWGTFNEKRKERMHSDWRVE